MRAIIPIMMLLLLVPAAVGYQQGHLTLDLPGWDVFEQRSAAQSFTKGDLWLEIRSYTDEATMAAAEDIAFSIGGAVKEESTQGAWTETVITAGSDAFVVAHATEGDYQYMLVMKGPSSKQLIVKNEMRKLYSQVTYAPDFSVVEAEFEEELLDPEELSVLEAHPIPWGWIIFWGIVIFIVYRKVQKRRKGKAKLGVDKSSDKSDLKSSKKVKKPEPDDKKKSDTAESD